MTDYDRDIDALRALSGSERDPSGTAFATLAHALLEAGRPTDAHDVVEAGRAHHPEFATGHLVAGLVDLALAAREPARAAFRRVLQLDPDNRVALRAIAQLYEEDGEPNEALAYLTPLAQIEPEEITLHERIIRLEASRDAGAVASELPPEPEHPSQPDPSALLFPDDPAPGEEHADDQPSMDALADDALAWVQERGKEAVPETPEEDLFTKTMAEVLANQGQFGESVEVYQKLIQKNPDNAGLREAMAAVEARMEAAGAASVEQEPPVARRSGAAAPEVRDYFEELLAAEGDRTVLGPEVLSEPADPVVDPAGLEATAEASGPEGALDPVPVAELGPDAAPVAALAPDAEVVVPTDPLAESTVSVAEPVQVGALAPDAESVAALAPEAVPVALLGPDPVAIAELAPDALDVRDLAPDPFQPGMGATE